MLETGRKKFSRWKWLIKFLVKIVSILPTSIRVTLMTMFSGLPGKPGVVLRYIIFSSLSKCCGDNVYIGRWCNIKNIGSISVGDNVSIHDYNYIDGFGELSIGSDVSIAHGTSILTFDHSYVKSSTPFKYQKVIMKPVEIHSNVWIGCGVRVLGGTTIFSDTVVGANSVVKHNLSSGLYVGIPATKKKDIL
ncbi:acyltransferase [Buttiauxella izardii]|uniref:Acyltransferase n=1 Tax=Buttiauxella izardii TaxID=82991 RepID=A0A3A5JZZ5_9ENTR|nr:acyltransferase [Buttiauxella izardii]RJT25974.1 acyltransferase [Buttiauxella izardii]